MTHLWGGRGLAAHDSGRLGVPRVRLAGDSGWPRAGSSPGPGVGRLADELDERLADTGDLLGRGDQEAMRAVGLGLEPGVAVVLEAGYMGLPVVATRVGGLPECVQDGEGGILVDPDSQEELVEATKSLILSPELRMKMGTRAQGWVRENQMIEHVADRYIEFYRRIQTGHETVEPVVN